MALQIVVLFFVSYIFSQNLRTRLIEYFFRVHEKTVSHEDADLYLKSLGDLCSAFGFRSPVDSRETRFPLETYRSISTPRVGVKVEAREARTTLTPERARVLRAGFPVSCLQEAGGGSRIRSRSRTRSPVILDYTNT